MFTQILNLEQDAALQVLFDIWEKQDWVWSYMSNILDILLLINLCYFRT